MYEKAEYGIRDDHGLSIAFLDSGIRNTDALLTNGIRNTKKRPYSVGIPEYGMYSASAEYPRNPNPCPVQEGSAAFGTVGSTTGVLKAFCKDYLIFFTNLFHKHFEYVF